MNEQSAFRYAFVTACTEFLYVAAPEPTKKRYVFKDRVALSLDKAYAYAVELHDAALLKKVISYFIEEFGANRLKEVRDISWVFGPKVESRHYRVTIEDNEGTQMVSDYRVTFDEDWQVTSAEEYNQVI